MYRVIAIAILAAGAGHAWEWGDEGHQIVATIARPVVEMPRRIAGVCFMQPRPSAYSRPEAVTDEGVRKIGQVRGAYRPDLCPPLLLSNS